MGEAFLVGICLQSCHHVGGGQSQLTFDGEEEHIHIGGKLFKTGTWFIWWLGDREACEVTTSSH